MKTIAKIFAVIAITLAFAGCCNTEKFNRKVEWVKVQEHDPDLIGIWAFPNQHNPAFIEFNADFREYGYSREKDGTLRSQLEGYWYTKDGRVYTIENSLNAQAYNEGSYSYHFSEDKSILYMAGITLTRAENVE